MPYDDDQVQDLLNDEKSNKSINNFESYAIMPQNIK